MNNLLLVLFLSLFLLGCSQYLTPVEKGSLIGSSIGSLGGAAIGNAQGETGWGVAVGGMIGALIGQETAAYYDEYPKAENTTITGPTREEKDYLREEQSLMRQRYYERNNYSY